MHDPDTDPRPLSALTIAGSDSGGGAGIQADLKTIAAHGVHGLSALAALTAQHTRGVTAVHLPPTGFLDAQIDACFEDFRIGAVKLGMLASAGVIEAVARALERHRPPQVVVDPVMVATSGARLLEADALDALRTRLLPLATVITPNLPEAGVLLEQRAPDTVKEMYRAAERLRELLPLASERWVLLKGGHLPGNDLVDLLFDGDRMVELPAQRIDTKNTHGTGCTLSSAIAALLPQAEGQFRPVETAVRHARQWLLGAIARSGELAVGSGHGPVHHFHALWRK